MTERQLILPSSGERYLPSMRGTIELEHLHRYALVVQAVAGMDVLDIASGEGYGSHLMAQSAKTVIGVDISSDAVSVASEAYRTQSNLAFKVGQCDLIPMPDGSVDAVISFETIEHHDRHEAMMAEIIRVLRPGGLLIISSPNKAVYTDATGYKNPYHVKELYFEEFDILLRKHFAHVEMYGQRISAGSILRPLQWRDVPKLDVVAGAGSRIVDSLLVPFSPMYYVAVCALRPEFPSLAPSIFLHAIDDVMEIERIQPAAVQLTDSIPVEFIVQPVLMNSGIDISLKELGFSGTTKGMMTGCLEIAEGGSEWRGWAIRTDSGAPAYRIVVGDDQQTVVVAPSIARPDVAARFNCLASWMSGFAIELEHLRNFQTDKVRIVGIDARIGAFELDVVRN
jgi:SAM-dependent methyltransferase